MVFESWREYLETDERFRILLLNPPESFLPYPLGVVAEAVNIVVKDYSDAGDVINAKMIKKLMGVRTDYFITASDGKLVAKESGTDEEMLVEMKESLDSILGDPALKKTVLADLKKAQDKWMEARRTFGELAAQGRFHHVW